MINPSASPWFKPKVTWIQDRQLYHRWAAVSQYLTSKPQLVEYRGILMINHCCYMAKNSSKIRLKSHLDWAWYTPKTLAQAIDANDIESYYEVMLQDVRSDPNVWKDTDFEMQLKSYYAARIGRASSI